MISVLFFIPSLAHQMQLTQFERAEIFCIAKLFIIDLKKESPNEKDS